MSYILDALRRADSERERGAVPGIHAQPVPITSEQDGRSPRIKPWMWGGFGVAMLLLGWFEWHDLQRASAPAEPAEPAARVNAARGDVPPAPPPRAELPTPPAVVRVPAPAPLPAARIAAAPPTAPSLPAPVMRTAAPLTGVASAPAAASSPAETRVYAVNELPDTIQRELPRLTISGSMYSDNAASRFLIINGQILHESDKVTPELTLEQIKLKAAVLRYKGYRYGISY